MKLFKNFLIFIFFALVGFGALYAYLSSNPQIKTISINEIFKSSKFSLLEAPSQSLRSEVKNLKGEVLWKNRISETGVKVSTLSKIQQGESVATGSDGYIDLDFLDTAYLKIEPDSEVEIIQTLPANLVFNQISGTISYQKVSVIPVSVRISPILVEVLGETVIGIEEITGAITIKGMSKIAYNDKGNTARLLEVEKGETVVFNPDTLKVVQE